MSTTYVFIIHFGVKIHKKVASKGPPSTSKTQRFHWEINRVLFAQALSPFFTGLVPTLFVAIAIFTQIKNRDITLVASMGFSWIGVLNPLFAIFMVRVYREAVFSPNMLCKTQHEQRKRRQNSYKNQGNSVEKVEKF